MPFLFRNLTLQPGEDEGRLVVLAARCFGLDAAALLQFRILRKGVDARKKPRVLLVYTASFCVADEAGFWKKHGGLPNLEQLPVETPQLFSRCSTAEPVVIVGMGPAGLFCALRLAAYGIAATILERGKPVEERVKDVARFWRDGALDPESNVQFGEGGAGTFSDGKLTCRLRDPNTGWVLDQLIRFGAPPEIRYQAKPHVGTDRLRRVVAALRAGLLESGADLRFSTCLTGLVCSNGQLRAVRSNQVDELACRHLVLAIGHSARDTYAMLSRQNLVMEAKPFAIGLRVEHPQGLIDRIQYGKPHPALPKADYALTYNNDLTRRSCYSFCMCPGGLVVASSSEAGMVVVNGMSNLGRDSGLANSALVVNVRPEDFDGKDPLAGVRFQQQWERTAFAAGGGGYCAPAQNLLAFIGQGTGGYCSSYRPGVVEADLASLLPEYVATTLREGIVSFDRKMKGFVTREATLTGVETRTSAPLRILRNEDCQSPALQGLYPCGEGAGYAGGIMSAALDGVRVADKIAEQLAP
ncbi:hypothetical protein FY034_16985 [Trichlorobacter lovleyi]|uniref:NAD(P)/FAD-dependent oxidoreductase n=1 Tax=Trichlorobacter lovleyi TaxID=313985 RepID=UPI0022402C60|nr:hypothetical protein [Trichlorobacter lovleyi]QOX80560.1 hypothetical protein FY034_16985 [Trichlorobacter lovleyi]